MILQRVAPLPRLPSLRHAVGMERQPTVIKATDFIGICEEMAMKSVPGHLRPTGRKVMWTILQLHYGDPACHFELQPQPSRNNIELGLHFEGEASLNEARALLIARECPAILASLGPQWELEEWTGSWRRLHRTFRAPTLTQAIAAEVATALTSLVTSTGSLVQEMSIARAVSSGG